MKRLGGNSNSMQVAYIRAEQDLSEADGAPTCQQCLSTFVWYVAAFLVWRKQHRLYPREKGSVPR